MMLFAALQGDDTGGTASSGLGTGLVESSKSEASDCTVGEALQNIPSNVLQLVLERCREETVDHLVVRQMLDELGNLTGKVRCFCLIFVDVGTCASQLVGSRIDWHDAASIC